MPASQKTKIFYLVVLAIFAQGCSSTFDTLHLNSLNSSSVKLVNSGLAGNQLCDLSSLSNTGADASSALQSCINQSNDGATIVVPQGKYTIAQQVVINRKITLTTLNSSSSVPCSADENHHCAEFKADPNIVVQNGFIYVPADTVHFDHIVVNGNKAARYNSQSGNMCRAGQNAYGYNIIFGGNNISVSNSVFKNALCATGGFFNGSNDVIQNNIITSNGTHNIQSMWSDGFTLADVPGAIITDNQFIDNTDVDFILGGCANCVIQRNQVNHSNSFASSSYAAIMIQAWPNGGTSGNYTGADISSNSVNCSSGQRCGFGIYIGASAWYPANIYGGNVHDNSVYGAQQGFAVDQVQNFSIANNQVDGAGGSFLASCGTRNYTAFVITPGTNVDRSHDGIADFNYASFSLAGCVPNWYTQDPGQRLAPTPAPTPSASENANAIYQLAIHVLGRDPNSLTPDQAMQWWGGGLAQGGTLNDIRLMFAASPEAAYAVRQIAVDILGRDPNTLSPEQAMIWWGGNLPYGGTLDDIRAWFAGSDEGANAVWNLAVNVLGRNPNSLTPAQAMGWWGGNLAYGGTLQDIRVMFANSPEAASVIYQMAINILGRDPNSFLPSQAMAIWGGNLPYGGTMQDIRTLFANSTEAANAVRQLAIDVLGRDPNTLTAAQAMYWWGAGLYNGGTLNDIRIIFENSAEGQAYRASH